MTVDPSAPVVASAQALVAAPPAVVWAVQSDLAAWPSWHPDVASIDLDGPVAPGTRFRWKAGGTSIRSEIQAVEPERLIGWTGRAPLGIRAVHVWTFEPEGDGTRVRTEESFDGWLVRLLPGLFRSMLRNALDSGVAALRAEAERRALD